MIDKFLDAGSTFDWITPLISLLRRDAVGLIVERQYHPWALATLETAGIWHSAGNLQGDWFMFDVRRRDYDRAYQLLYGERLG